MIVLGSSPARNGAQCGLVARASDVTLSGGLPRTPAGRAEFGVHTYPHHALNANGSNVSVHNDAGIAQLLSDQTLRAGDEPSFGRISVRVYFSDILATIINCIWQHS